MKLSLNFVWKDGPRYLMILIFGLAIYGKLLGAEAFFQITDALSLSPELGKILLALVLSMESTAIVFLLWQPREGILLSIAELSIFTIVIFLLYLKGVQNSCACFGNLVESKIGPLKMIQNVGLIILLAVCLQLRK